MRGSVTELLRGREVSLSSQPDVRLEIICAARKCILGNKDAARPKRVQFRRQTGFFSAKNNNRRIVELPIDRRQGVRSLQESIRQDSA